MGRWKEDPEFKVRSKKYKLKYEYGITPDDYDKMYDEQEGLCKSCGIEIERQGKFTNIDHDHNYPKSSELGKYQKDPRSILGLLCMACNTSRGQLGNDAERIRKLWEYQLWIDEKLQNFSKVV
tara:strand:+ start:324 stop:692 length:369 start_codon:yes stop_codon:yes gene_type:complete